MWLGSVPCVDAVAGDFHNRADIEAPNFGLKSKSSTWLRCGSG